MSVFDACVHQQTIDLDRMKDLVPKKWKTRISRKAKFQDPISGTLMPTLPWFHSYWNEDAPDWEAKPEHYRDPEKFDKFLDERGIDIALLSGHEIRFLPSLPSPEYSSAIASAYNTVLVEDWLEDFPRFKGGIVVRMDSPRRAVEEIEKYLEVDSLRYLSLKGMLSLKSLPDTTFCSSCFSGKYPIRVPKPNGKESFEIKSPGRMGM